SGENAPAGPMYERDGSPRPSWFDPLGFAGLDQVPPPPRELQALTDERIQLEARQAELASVIDAASSSLEELGARLRSMHGNPHLAAESEKLAQDVAARSATLTGLRKERRENEAVLEALDRTTERRRRGAADDPRAHIRKAAEPVSASQIRFDKAAEIWAAISASVLLIGLAVLILTAPDKLWALLIVVLVAFAIGESILRGTFLHTANRIAVILALIAAVVLFVHAWIFILAVLFIGVAAYLLYPRIPELRG